MSRVALALTAVIVATGVAGALAAPASKTRAAAERTAAAAPPDVGLIGWVGLDLDYRVSWTEVSGSQSEECNSWKITRGWTRVTVKNTRRRSIPGGFNIFGQANNDPTTGGWAVGSAVGKAKVTMRRTLDVTAGTTACGSAPATILPGAPNDCLGGRPRSFTIRNAVVRPEVRKSLILLSDLTRPTPPREGDHAVFSVTAVGRSPYRNCPMNGWAPEQTFSMGVEVTLPEYRALRRLQPRQTLPIRASHIGPCQLFIDRPDSCTFTFDATLQIRRRHPSERFP